MPCIAVIGAFSHVSGLGHMAHQVTSNLGSWGYPIQVVDEGQLVGRADRRAVYAVAQADILLFVLMPDGMDEALRSIGKKRLQGKRVVANWWWEVLPWPDDPRLFDMVHAVWTGSPFVAQVISQATSKPVRTLPLRWSPRGEPNLRKAARPLFAVCFDFRSMMARKNPLAAVAAFKEAFPAMGRARLLIKTQHGNERPVEVKALREAIAHRQDIEWVDAPWDDGRMERLYDDMDVLVSLHRGEALGLPLVEAMRRGKPVVATRFGGVADLMTEHDWPIDFRRVLVGPGHAPFSPDAEWGEPLHAQAVQALREAADQVSGGIRCEPREVALVPGDPRQVMASMVEELLAQDQTIRLRRRTPRMRVRRWIFRLHLERAARWTLAMLRRMRV